MTVCFLADLHVANHKRHGGPVKAGINRRCQHVLDALESAYKRAERLDAKAVVILGDLFRGAWVYRKSAQRWWGMAVASKPMSAPTMPHHHCALARFPGLGVGGGVGGVGFFGGDVDFALGGDAGLEVLDGFAQSASQLWEASRAKQDDQDTQDDE